MSDTTAAAHAEFAHVESPWRSASAEDRVRRRRLLLLVAALFTGVAAAFGFPTGREVLTGWVLLFLLAACAGNLRAWGRAVVRDWLPLFAVLFAYDLLRGLAPGIGARLAHLPTLQADLVNPALTEKAHLTEPIDGDRLLFGGHVPTVDLQQHFYTAGHVHWWDALAVPVYFSHFFVSLGVAVLLWALSYRLFRRYVWTLVTLTVVTLITYAVFPAAPPWMAGLRRGVLQPGGSHAVPPRRHPDDAVAVRLARRPGALAGAAVLLLPRDAADPCVRRGALRHRHPGRICVRRRCRLRCSLVVRPVNPGPAGHLDRRGTRSVCNGHRPIDEPWR